MKYQSKKDPEVYARFIEKDEKTKVNILEYETGEKAGKQFLVSSSTLKRWWKIVEDDDISSVSKLTDEQIEQINTPYPKPKEQKYVPVPKSVIEYEENKKRAHLGKRAAQFDVPSNYDDLADLLVEHGVEIYRVNKWYISLKDLTKFKILSSGIGILASNDVAEKLSNQGLISKPCIEKGTPFRYDIRTQEDYDKMWEALK